MLVFSFIVLMALQIWRVQPLKEQGHG
jgi:hypothetical protein